MQTEFPITDTEIAEAFAAIDAGLARLAKIDPARLGWRDRVGLLSGLESVERQVPSIEHGVVATMDRLGDKRAAGVPNTRMLIADVLRVTETDASHRIGMARELAPRIVNGENVHPALPATAAVLTEGRIGEPHVRIIRSFLHELPEKVAPEVRADAEEQLADLATQVRPDQLAEYAKQLAGFINPDGKFSDADRQRKRGFTLDKPGLDHMSSGKLCADPELTALLDVVIAKHGAPGAGVDGIDTRTAAQRRHDALAIALRGYLETGQAGTHRGLLPQVIVTTTLRELQAAVEAATDGQVPAGFGTTGAGKLIPMADLIRLASESIQYLAVFHDADERPLYLGRTARLASRDQRIMCIARDKGCTFPDCNAGGYWTEIHHTIEWVNGGSPMPTC